MQYNLDNKDSYKEGTLGDTTDAYRVSSASSAASSASSAASSASSVNGFIGNALIGFIKVNGDIKPFKGNRKDMVFMVTYIDIQTN